MKTQQYGVLDPRDRRESVGKTFTPTLLIDALELNFVTSRVRLDFKNKRLNGDEKKDIPGRDLPKDGKITWTKGEKKGDGTVYGVKESDGYYHYECRYDAGPQDLEWMRQTDCNYLKRILREGNLQKLEPDVWRLREMDKAQEMDIGEWWSQVLELEDIGDLLANSATEYQKFAEQPEEKERITKQREAEEKARIAQQREKEEKERQRQEQLRREKEQRETFLTQEKLAKAGNEIAQNYVGWCYEKGQGVTQDLTQAAYWYLKAIPKNDHAKEAMERLRTTYATAVKAAQQIIQAEQKKQEEEEIAKLEAQLAQQRLEKKLEGQRAAKLVQPRTAVSEGSTSVFGKPTSFYSGTAVESIVLTPKKSDPKGGLKEEKALDEKASQRGYQLDHSKLSLGKLLGEGGFGAVYGGTYQHGEVAIKKLLVKEMTETTEKEFKNETSIMAKSKHPNIVTLYGYTVSPYCMVMELLSGSLFNVLHSKQQLQWNLRLQMAQDIAAGLAHLHDHGIIHRDLKSLNVLLTVGMRAKLTDFGLSKLKTETKTTTKPKEGSVGTPPWMAPELFGIRPKYSNASDIYAYAMVLWELSTRALPYQGVDREEIRDAVKKGEREEIPADCPLKIASLIKFCWHQDSTKRPTAERVCAYLQDESEKEFKETVGVDSYRGNLFSLSSTFPASFAYAGAAASVSTSAPAVPAFSYRGNLSSLPEGPK